MADPLATFDSWPAIAVAITAAVAGALVPLNGFVKTLLDYRIEAKKAEALKPETAREVANASGCAVFDSIAMADLTAAVHDLTAAIRADTASDQAQHGRDLAVAIQKFSDRMDRWEDHEMQHGTHPPRGRRS